MGGSSSSQTAPAARAASAASAAAAVPTQIEGSDDSKIDDITVKLTEKEKMMSQKEYFKMIEERKEKVEKTLADLDKNPNVKSYLAAIDSNIGCDDEAFKMLSSAVKSSAEFYKLFSQLKAYGITKNEKYLDVLKQLLGLYQKQWKLLDDTLIEMKELGGECEICYYDVKRFQKEINNLKMNNGSNNDTKQVPNTKLIDKSMNSLTNWMKNKDKVKRVLTEWRDFKNEVETFNLHWDVVKDGIIEEIKNKCASWWERNKAPLCGTGGGLLGFTIAFSFTHVITCVAAVFFPIVGVVALTSLVGVAGGVAYRHYKGREQIHLAKKEMVSGIEKMEERLQDMLKSSIRIESLCGQLNQSMVEQGIETKIIKDCVDYEEWDENISNHLTRIEQSLNKFKLNCYQIAKEITQTQQSIIKIKMSQI